jgi:hypothetical protein
MARNEEEPYLVDSGACMPRLIKVFGQEETLIVGEKKNPF